jgi:ABC-type xylose transport system substrate-binding protein|tara:strand:- start:149 stop:469 length:321 start_codon:yes stop_codon:yes gene_type:complete
MKSVKAKIKSALLGGENNEMSLNANELSSLVRMNRVNTFIISAGIDRFISNNTDDGYYPSFGAISINRNQAKEIVKDFKDYSVKDNKPLYARVRVSEYSDRLSIIL